MQTFYKSLCLYFNSADVELRHAAFEQQKITEKRLADTIARQQHDTTRSMDRRAATLASQISSSSNRGSTQPPPKAKTSPITTHVLDTCNGRPAAGVPIDLEHCSSPSSQVWVPIGRGKTNTDGRLSDLMPAGNPPSPGWYCLTFHVGEYLEQCRLENPTFFRDAPFYPFVKIHFTIRQDQVRDDETAVYHLCYLLEGQMQVNQHFHVPLTWNPFGYCTYRGS